MHLFPKGETKAVGLVSQRKQCQGLASWPSDLSLDALGAAVLSKGDTLGPVAPQRALALCV